ncbi:esterase family protein [Mycobacterium sp. Y57]|uniref:alpha/beta hydrolase n=1 Tax=Mycolicibacterium xanthum TaxID=2796469 RepID=UPI001C845909|nr:alpha/beta hydrolase-fold protein [Mycolicibacterium xanthum]MBX7434317.1 esterase family protein [Mycolicibacterium xanthum]
MTLPFVLHDPLLLTHGWLPVLVQVLAAVALVTAIGWRNRRWRTVWLPWSALVGAALAAATYGYIRSADLADDTNPAPHTLWLWIALSGMAVGVLVSGWASAPWWRRCASVLAVPLSVLAAALGLNLWTGYFPTAASVWTQVTAGPLPDQTDQVTIAAMQKRHVLPPRGSVIAVDIPDTASGFAHRREYVYLPPAWYESGPPPALPTVMMIGGDINTPADWMRAGGAINTIDRFAAAHHGYAPVLVFVDPGGTFNNDTECVNGSRGNSANHLTEDVVPFIESRYGVSANAANWGVVGWSMGGTCALDLAVMHPDMFSAFEDIAGDLVPNAGNRRQTIDRLFGGNAVAYASFDPTQVIARHGPYRDTAGWFDVNFTTSSAPPNEQTVAARTLCAQGRPAGIDCAVVAQPGNHDWPFASQAFTAALPWLAGALDTPDVPHVGLPVGVTPVAAVTAAG